MSTAPVTIEFLLSQLATIRVTSRKMFGEYALYCDGTVVALVCDDELFVKPTQAGRSYLTDVIEKAPYPGAKPFLWIAGEYWDDSEWLCELITITTAELPIPKKKKLSASRPVV